MTKITCNECGEELVTSERGETVVRGTTPLKHMQETGHSPRAPVLHACHDCDNVWWYTGNSDYPTCPECKGKNTDPVEE